MKLSLRSRYGAALAIVVIALSGVFAAAMGYFVEVLEYELLHDTLARELAEQRDLLATNPSWTGPSDTNLKRVVVDYDRLAGLPAALADLDPGLEGEVELDGRTYLAARADVGTQRLYLLLDIGPVEVIEQRLVWVAALTALAAAMIAVLLGLALGRRVLRPVSELADDVARLDPERPIPRLASTHVTAEIQPIAQAIDQFRGRLQGFVERERAFTADVSHELRTPLATMRSAADLLLAQDDLSAETRARAERIQRAAERMQMMATTFLFLARESSGLEWPLCSVTSLATEAMDMLEDAATAKGLQLELVVESEQVVRAPPVMVSCIVQNLLANAIAASNDGIVTVRVGSQGIAVEDTGPGVDPAALARILERGYRGSRSSGAGLGLDIVRRLADHLGWKLSVTNRLRGGTRFLVVPPTRLGAAHGGVSESGLGQEGAESGASTPRDA
jgi:signal transduction histidine kinase